MSSKTYENIIEQISALTVLELSELVKALEEKFGVSAAMPVAAAAAPVAAAAPAAAEEKAEYKVTLKEAGPEKIATIKVLKAVAGLSLSAAKTAADSAPTVIVESAPKDDANKMKKEL